MISCYILDIDGTLMDTAELDNRCYWQAVSEVCEQSVHVDDLTGYRHVTDNGILQQWYRNAYGEDPSAETVRNIKRVFLQRTQAAARSEPASFLATSGLEDWLEQCHQRGIAIALATGGWGLTARFKLEQAGLDRFHLPLACSDDALSRADIMRHAQSLVAATMPADEICYVGDGPWDYQASQDLGWRFIGLASGERARILSRQGAQTVHSDFSSFD